MYTNTATSRFRKRPVRGFTALMRNRQQRQEQRGHREARSATTARPGWRGWDRPAAGAVARDFCDGRKLLAFALLDAHGVLAERLDAIVGLARRAVVAAAVQRHQVAITVALPSPGSPGSPRPPTCRPSRTSCTKMLATWVRSGDSFSTKNTRSAFFDSLNTPVKPPRRHRGSRADGGTARPCRSPRASGRCSAGRPAP